MSTSQERYTAPQSPEQNERPLFPAVRIKCQGKGLVFGTVKTSHSRVPRRLAPWLRLFITSPCSEFGRSVEFFVLRGPLRSCPHLAEFLRGSNKEEETLLCAQGLWFWFAEPPGLAQVLSCSHLLVPAPLGHSPQALSSLPPCPRLPSLPRGSPASPGFELSSPSYHAPLTSDCRALTPEESLNIPPSMAPLVLAFPSESILMKATPQFYSDASPGAGSCHMDQKGGRTALGLLCSSVTAAQVGRKASWPKIDSGSFLRMPITLGPGKTDVRIACLLVAGSPGLG